MKMRFTRADEEGWMMPNTAFPLLAQARRIERLSRKLKSTLNSNPKVNDSVHSNRQQIPNPFQLLQLMKMVDKSAESDKKSNVKKSMIQPRPQRQSKKKIRLPSFDENREVRHEDQNVLPFSSFFCPQGFPFQFPFQGHPMWPHPGTQNPTLYPQINEKESFDSKEYAPPIIDNVKEVKQKTNPSSKKKPPVFRISSNFNVSQIKQKQDQKISPQILTHNQESYEEEEEEPKTPKVDSSKHDEITDRESGPSLMNSSSQRNTDVSIREDIINRRIKVSFKGAVRAILWLIRMRNSILVTIELRREVCDNFYKSFLPKLEESLIEQFFETMKKYLGHFMENSKYRNLAVIFVNNGGVQQAECRPYNQFLTSVFFGLEEFVRDTSSNDLLFMFACKLKSLCHRKFLLSSSRILFKNRTPPNVFHR